MPGFRFASATSSATEPTPSDGCAASSTGWRESCVTGRKSRRGSKPRLEYRCGAVVIPSVPTSIVYPSGALLATYSMPIWPAAPVRFSTMPAWPKTCLSRSATGRVAMSVEPPAGKGTIHRIGFDGHGCASARLVASDRKSATKTRRSNVWIAQLCTLASQRKRSPAEIPGADASSEPGCSRDQKQPCPDGDGPGGSRDALAGRRETFDGDGCRHDSHRAKVHDPDDQEDRYQTDTALAAVEAKAQAVSPGRVGVGRQRDAQRKGGHSKHGPDEEVAHTHERGQPNEARLACPADGLA